MAKFFYHRNTGRLYKIEALDKATNTITLSNEMATFSDTFDKERFKAQGYFPIDGDDEDDARANAQAKIAEEKAAQSPEDDE